MNRTYGMVSFLIAAYNEEEFIVECIDSCLNQTYQDVEVCIVDDGSTDDTWNIISTYKKSNIKIYKFKENQGKVSAFNKAFSLSSGDYIAIIGADDIVAKERVEVSIKEIGRYDLIFGDLSSFYNNKILMWSVMEEQFHVNTSREFTFSDLLINPVVYGGTIFAKRKLFNSIFPLYGKLSHEDWWIPLVAASKKPIKYIHCRMIYYRMHKGQTSCCFDRMVDYKKWINIKVRDLFFYQKIKKEFVLTEKELKFIEDEIFKIKIYSENCILKRIDIFYSHKKKYRLCLVKFFIFSVIGPNIAYWLYIIKNYLPKKK